MEKKELSTQVRLLIAIGISLLIFLASQYYALKMAPPAKPQAQATSNSAQTPTAPPTSPSTPVTGSPAPVGDLKVGSTEQEVTVESDTYKIVFSTRGAVVKSWTLKGYRDERNNPLDLVNASAAQEFGFPLSVWTPDEATRQAVNGALFVPSLTGSVKAPATLVFEFTNSQIAARKEITLSDKGFVLDLKTDVWSGGRPVPHELAWRGSFGDVHDIGMSGSTPTAFYRESQKLVKLTDGDVKAGELTVSGPYEFAGVEDRFFTALFLPPANTQSSSLRVVAFRHEIVPPGQEKKRPFMGVAVASADSAQNNLRLFVGPKQTDELAKLQQHLPELVDYGWFYIVSKPLFLAMRWIHDSGVRNYGWAIIILTVFINFALFPLKLKSLRSTMRMQKLQPQIRAIQDRFKQYKMNDPRKAEMNTEMMALYKENGVNPLGGCLPMLIQIPFLYGFYKVLVVSIEMRHAPWILWIHDLSTSENLPIKILPLAMCATQFVLQRMSPSPSPDPAQQKIMMFMPLMMLFMFWSLSSGLVLYWFTGNVVGIAQQWYINRTEMQEAIEKRKAAKVGKAKK